MSPVSGVELKTESLDVRHCKLQSSSFFLDNEGFLLFFIDGSFHNKTKLLREFPLTISCNSQTFFSPIA